ncbi:MAG: hypothetical protein B0D92_05050 [Spirochaeta sp. LUC14_002_19_P3]|nr:MAG: hypothetical protein B0D92_05050 [Spirochaeta sp. LUC14_002_19_P3]
MNIQKIPVEIADNKNTKDFGTLISSNYHPAKYKGNDFRLFLNIAENKFAGNVSFSIVDSYRSAGNITASLEYHLKTKEALIPTQSDIVLILAKPKLETPDIATARAFRIKQGDAFIIHEGVWHYAPLTEKESAKTFVVFTSTTPYDDVVLVDLEKEFGRVLGI